MVTKIISLVAYYDFFSEGYLRFIQGEAKGKPLPLPREQFENCGVIFYSNISYASSRTETGADFVIVLKTGEYFFAICINSFFCSSGASVSILK